MMSLELREFKSWGEKMDAEVRVIEEDYTGYERVYAVFEYNEPRITPSGIVKTPKAYIKTTMHADEFWFEAGDSLDVTVEEWVGPSQDDYSLEENVQSTGPSGAESHANMWGDDFRVQEVAEDGWNRVITVEVK